MKRVIIESPYACDVEENLRYLRACLRDSFMRGEAPFASHGLYTHVLDDSLPEERVNGIAAGLAWAVKADLVVVYEDKGISQSMKIGIKWAEAHGVPVEFRKLYK